MNPQAATPYPGSAPRIDNLRLLARVWNARLSGAVTSDWGRFVLIGGEPRSWQDDRVLQKALYMSVGLTFKNLDAVGRDVTPQMGALLWDAAGRIATPRTLNPRTLLVLEALVRDDLPLHPATRELLPERPGTLSLKGLLRLDRATRAKVLHDLGKLVAMGLAGQEEEEKPVLSAEEELLQRVRAALDEERVLDALELLVLGKSTPATRAWMGWAVYNDPSRPEAHRHTAGRMLLRAAAAEGSLDALVLMGRTLALEGKTEQARARAQAVLEADPSHAEAKELLATLGQRP